MSGLDPFSCDNNQAESSHCFSFLRWLPLKLQLSVDKDLTAGRTALLVCCIIQQNFLIFQLSLRHFAESTVNSTKYYYKKTFY